MKSSETLDLYISVDTKCLRRPSWEIYNPDSSLDFTIKESNRKACRRKKHRERKERRQEWEDKLRFSLVAMARPNYWKQLELQRFIYRRLEVLLLGFLSFYVDDTVPFFWFLSFELFEAYGYCLFSIISIGANRAFSKWRVAFRLG